jgi:dihydrofolate reductase
MTERLSGTNLWVLGGGDLVGQFHDAGLLDEIILGMTPVALGRGAPLLRAGSSALPPRPGLAAG